MIKLVLERYIGAVRPAFLQSNFIFAIVSKGNHLVLEESARIKRNTLTIRGCTLRFSGQAAKE